ncbi:MAG: polysaccharide biosynthesis tyrosine autokinase, partial [Prolixibacteraceae bacterium]|nr:polysaccharide biosynthesis tyrosine autokinase [Prolixibacteraceae bacterium]
QNNFNNQDEETIDLKLLFNYLIGNIWWFALSIFLALVIAFLANRYTTKIYNISTTVLISDDTKGSPFGKNVGGSLDMLSGFGMYPSLENFENQSIILKSYSQVRRTIDQLNFEVSYYSQGRIARNEIYTAAPFEVIFSDDHPQLLGAKFMLSIDQDGMMKIDLNADEGQLYHYGNDEVLGKVSGLDYSAKVKPGERIQTEHFDFYLKIRENFNPEVTNNYYFYFNNPHQLTLSYQNRLVLEPMSKGASMLQISIEDQNASKAIDFLNKLTSEYLLRNLEKKNEIANNTIQFIDSQLDTISKSLNIAETDLQTFRSKNKMMDLSFQSQQVFQQLQDLENQKMEVEMQNQYYKYLLTYIEENQDVESILAPSAMGVNDPLLNSLILEINQLSVEKSSLTNIKKGADFGPLQKLDAQIRNAKDNISENASNLVKSSNISLNELNKRINRLMASINDLPETERQLFGIQRKFVLNDNLYTFLLERRAEAQIAKASNTADNEIIDPAMVTGNGAPIKPKKMINFAIALILGFVVPALVIFLKEFFNMKVDSPEVVKRMTNKPIIGYIPNSGVGDLTISDAPDSPWAEAFRIVRTKLQFTIKEKQHPVVLVTSSVPGEGKSFIAINLASVNAIAGKKTVLVGFDLRRPQIAQRFKIDKNMGVTNYLIGDATIDQIIQKTGNPFLDVIPSGIIPPNPAELISDEKTLVFLEELRKRYDYIVLDTAPLSPVSDSHHLCRLADAILFVVRDKYTHKQIMQSTLDELKSNNQENLSIIINDIQLNRKRYGGKYGYSYGYRYGYKYGYGYGYGYYQGTVNDKKSWFTSKKGK